jgi:hypothetical protein
MWLEALRLGRTLSFRFDLIRFSAHTPRTELIWLHNLDGITCRLPKEGDIICGRLVNSIGLVIGGKN